MGVNSSPSQVSVRACHARCVLSIQVTTHVTWRESESECDSGVCGRSGFTHAARDGSRVWPWRRRPWEVGAMLGAMLWARRVGV